MSKDKKFEFDANGYEVWMKQTQVFFATAEKNLKEIFSQNEFLNPEAHFKQIHKWLNLLKNEWDYSQLHEQHVAFERYGKIMIKICNDATDLMLEQWMQRAREHHPIKTIRELYELWLDCCQQIYKKSLTSKDFHQAYGDYMNAALQFWKSSLTNEMND